MPGGKRGGKSTVEVQKKVAKNKEPDPEKLSEQDIYEMDKDIDSPQAGLSGDLPRNRGKKRRLADDDQCENEMQSLIAGFKADVSKTLDAKKKRLETFTQASLKASNTKVEKIWKAQAAERQRLGEEFNHQSLAVLDQWEADLQRSKEAEEKLGSVLKQQQKLFQQQRVVQAQRLKTIRQLQEQFAKSMSELDTCHYKQQADMQTELKKEMSLLQKRLLMETQNQEISNVRRSLHSMLFQE